MRFDSKFCSRDEIQRLLTRIAELCRGMGPVRLMEICGTHTMAIAKAGLRSILPDTLRLVSGPGCPVCVTPAGVIDEILRMSAQSGVVIASYGDLLRVPGTARGDTLARRKAMGARVHTVYSPMEAMALAQDHPELEVVFLGVGFETTAPGTAACMLEARERNVRNFSLLSLLKQTEPALRALIAASDFAVDGFLCPGHVAAITGARAFSFLPQEFGLPAVVSGFEPSDLIFSIYRLVSMLAYGEPALENEYTRVVSEVGNQAAQRAVSEVFCPAESIWRGLGSIPNSGLVLRQDFAEWDATHKFDVQIQPGKEPSGCCCGSVIRGVMSPERCPLFGRVCTPADPVGPCMVSSEGACAAMYRYRQE